MKIGLEASKATGISREHAEQGFQKIADQWHSVIVSRAVGKVCLGPIREGYASKSFHVKAKSCNWGPMAGFLLEDKRLTKRKQMEGEEKKGWAKQKTDIEESYEGGFCTFTPLLISKNRIKYILDNKYAKPLEENISSKNFPNRFDVTAISPDKETYRFTIIKRNQVKQAKTQTAMWGVYFADGTEAASDQREKQKDDTGLVPVRAIVNARRERDRAETESLRAIDKQRGMGAHQRAAKKVALKEKLAQRYAADSGWVEGYRGACTGDYDLFAIFPPTAELVKAKRQLGWIGNIPFEMEGVDIRPVKLGIKPDPNLDEKERKAKLKKELAGEHPDLGNMTARIYMIRDNLNEAFQKVDKWRDRIMVHHSDEGGRPFWPDLDYPLHAFVPNEKDHYALENATDLIAFFKRMDKLGYKIVIPPNWEKELKLKQIQLNYVVPKWSKAIRKRADLVSKSKSLAEQHSLEPVLLNGMSVLFDKAVATTPVSLVPRIR
ncbi:MAG: anthrax toxin-like adenylyl cyclase domain-containing protein [Cyanobacteria bacterium J06634_5]